MKKIAILLAALLLCAGCSQQEDSTTGKNEAPASSETAAQQTEPAPQSEAPSEEKTPASMDDNSSDTSTEHTDRENSIIETPEEFLGLPVWEMERQAMSRLQAASQSTTVEQMRQELQQARNLFASLEKNISQLSITNNENVQQLYDMQKEIVTDYKQHIDRYLNSSDPDALKSLQKVDQAFINFIKTAKDVVAADE